MGPRRIVCLTEETTEWLYLLGEEHRIVGISGYTVRPKRARQEKPRIASFLDGRVDRIVALRPDLVIGFSDLQADLAARLIRAGLDVLVTNQRGVDDIVSTMRTVAALVDASDRAEAWLEDWSARRSAMQRVVGAWPRRPRVYFEEWDEPMISAIRWVSELVTMAGGDDVFPDLARQPMGRDRIIGSADEPVRRSPDVYVASWCGKKFRPERVVARPGWNAMPAVRDGELHAIPSCDILQPGPAALTDGLDALHAICARWVARHR